MSRSSRHRWQRKSPSSLFRYAHLLQPPCATNAARLLRQLAALRSRHGWQLAYHPPSGLGARFRLQRGCEHSSGSSCRTACGTKPGGSPPLHWAMRVESSMSFSVSGVATRCASVPEWAARARKAVTSRQRGRSASGEPGTRPIGVDVSGLTAGARVRRWAGIDGRSTVVFGRKRDARCARSQGTSRGRLLRVRGLRIVAVVPSGMPWSVNPSERSAQVARAAMGRVSARRAQASAIVTRMGRDRASGLGSPKATRARAGRRRPKKNRSWKLSGLLSRIQRGTGARHLRGGSRPGSAPCRERARDLPD